LRIESGRNWSGLGPGCRIGVNWTNEARQKSAAGHFDELFFELSEQTVFGTIVYLFTFLRDCLFTPFEHLLALVNYFVYVFVKCSMLEIKENIKFNLTLCIFTKIMRFFIFIFINNKEFAQG
jgi:hypothetical protein